MKPTSGPGVVIFKKKATRVVSKIISMAYNDLFENG